NAARSGVARDAQDFLGRGGARLDPALAVVAQRAHAPAQGLGAQGLFVAPLVDQAPHVLVHGEQLVDAGAAAIASVIARRAAYRTVDHAPVRQGIRPAAFVA